MFVSAQFRTKEPSGCSPGEAPTGQARDASSSGCGCQSVISGPSVPQASFSWALTLATSAATAAESTAAPASSSAESNSWSRASHSGWLVGDVTPVTQGLLRFAAPLEVRTYLKKERAHRPRDWPLSK